MNKIITVITAGGSGKRMGSLTKKQYLELKGKAVLARTVEVFQNISIINEIVIVCPSEDIEFINDEIVEKYKFSKVLKIVAGGKERQDSVWNALKECNAEDDDMILIHDGVRPFLSETAVLNSIIQAKITGASVVGVKLKDTVKKVDGSKVTGTVDRSQLIAVQTPQTFRYDLIDSCYRKAYDENFYSTDDSALVEKYSPETKITLVEGDYKNFKITTIEDMIFAKAVIDNQ